jgi:hypothetical protein
VGTIHYQPLWGVFVDYLQPPLPMCDNFGWNRHWTGGFEQDTSDYDHSQHHLRKGVDFGMGISPYGSLGLCGYFQTARSGSDLLFRRGGGRGRVDLLFTRVALVRDFKKSANLLPQPSSLYR